MSVHNNAPFLDAAIGSVRAQSFADFEFLIVDDGSTDGSGAIIDAHAAADGRIRAIHQPNRGLVASLNRMLAEARAPLVARMDGDDVSEPERFARQLAFLQANPDHGAVGSWARSIDAAGQPLFNDEQCRDQPVTHGDVQRAAKAGEPLLCHPSVVMRRELVLALGGYRAQYRHCEDFDLWLRLSEHAKIASLPERLVQYRYSDSQVSARHALAQQYGAAVAWLAHLERLAGRPDPTDGLAELPPIAGLNALFGRAGVSEAVRARVAPGIVYSETALAGEGFPLLLDHVRAGGSRDGLWRTAARLVRLGRPFRALRLAAALATR